jgi:Flp pilus assembly pilin Flp
MERRMMKAAIRFFQDDAGTTAAEYSIMAALIAVVIIGSVIFLGEEVRRLFELTVTEMTNHGI